MVGVDSNILLRLLVKDDVAQANSAERLLLDNGGFFVADVVLVEAVWTLADSYDFDKPKILAAVDFLISHSGVKMEDEKAIRQARKIYDDKSGVGFADCLILVKNQERDTILFTFDQKLARLEGAKLLR